MKPNKTLFGAFVISVTLIIGACQQTELSDSAPTPSLPRTGGGIRRKRFRSVGRRRGGGRPHFPQRQPSDPCRQRCSRPQRRDDPRRSRASGNLCGQPARGLPAGLRHQTLLSYPGADRPRHLHTRPRTERAGRRLAGDDRDDRGRTRLRRHLRLPLRMASYEERTRPERVQTRALSDKFYAMQDEWFQKWYDEGADTYFLYKRPENLPEDIYQRFCETAEGDDAGTTPPTTAWSRGIITVKYHESGNKERPVPHDEMETICTL